MIDTLLPCLRFYLDLFVALDDHDRCMLGFVMV